MSTTPEPVNHPPHYLGADGLEEVDVLETQWGFEFHLPFAHAYIVRHRRKGRPIEDLRKARWWLARLKGAIERSLREGRGPGRGAPAVREVSRIAPDRVAAAFGLSANLLALLWDLEKVSTNAGNGERARRLGEAIARLEAEVVSLGSEAP